MAQLHKVLAILLVCYSANSLASSMSSYSKSWSIPPSNTTFLHQGTLFATDASTYPMAQCEITDLKKERVCSITLVTQGLSDRTCKGVKIFADEGKELFFNGFFQVTPFTRDYVAVGWYDQPEGSEIKLNHSFKVTLLNVNTCASAHLSFVIDEVAYGFFPAVIYYDNQVDFVLNSKQACNGQAKCKLTFDLEGKQIGGVKPYYPDVSQYASPVSEQDPSKGFFVHSQDLKSLTVLLVDNEGQGKQLSTVNFEPETSEQDRLLSFSNAHELYSICRMHKGANPTSIDCAQYDGNGQNKANASIELGQSADWLAVRSLSSGKILVATSGSDANKPQNFRVYTVQGDEAPKKHVELEGPSVACKDKDNGLEIRISENDKNLFCFEFSCLQGMNNLKFFGKCVSEDLLS